MITITGLAPQLSSHQPYQINISLTNLLVLLGILWHTLHALLALLAFFTMACYIGSREFHVGWRPRHHIAVPQFDEVNGVMVHLRVSDQSNDVLPSRYPEEALSPAVSLQLALLGFERPVTASITNLPTELLILVFEAVLIPRNRAQTHTLLYLSHVCRRWRCVILASCSLWSLAVDVAHSSPLFAEELLRSKPMLLDFCIDLPQLPQAHNHNAQMISNLAVATQHFLRIRTFWISGTAGEIMSLINSGCWISANALETFSLHNTLAPSYLDTAPVLPHVFMGLHAPRLQTFHVVGCALDWANFRFSSLRHLSIHHVPPWAKPSQDQIVSSLQLVPRLETLSLHDVLSTSEEPTSSSTATLADLRSISLLGPIRACAELLLHVNLPSLEDITCLLECPDSAPSSYIPLLLQAISTTGGRVRPSTVVLRCVEDELEVRATDNILPQECLVIHLVWPSPLPGQQMLLTLIDLCRALPFTQIEKLHFDDVHADCFPHSLLWAQLFECFPAVTNLYLCNDDYTPDKLVNELIIDSSNTRDMMQIEQSFPVLLPGLKELYTQWFSPSLCSQAQRLAELREAIGRPMEVWPRDIDNSIALPLIV